MVLVHFWYINNWISLFYRSNRNRDAFASVYKFNIIEWCGVCVSICEWTVMWRKEHTTFAISQLTVRWRCQVWEFNFQFVVFRYKTNSLTSSPTNKWKHKCATGSIWIVKTESIERRMQRIVSSTLSAVKNQCAAWLYHARAVTIFLCANESCQPSEMKINQQKSHNKNAWDSTLTFISIYTYVFFAWYFPAFCASIALSICYGWPFYVRALYPPIRVCMSVRGYVSQKCFWYFIFFWFLFRIAMHFSSVQFVWLKTRVPVNLSQPRVKSQIIKLSERRSKLQI